MSVSAYLGGKFMMVDSLGQGGVCDLMATYREAEDLINIGAYVAGSNPRVDLALARIDSIKMFLRQGIYEQTSFEQAQAAVMMLG